MRGGRLVILVLLVAVVVMGGILARSRVQQSAGAGPVVVYAPCGLQGPLQVAVHLFRAAHRDVPLEVKYDNANILVRRVLEQGARPDAFVSPGELELSQIAEAGLLDKQTVRDFGSLDMVLIAPAGAKAVTSIEDLASPHVTTVALGDPASNSVGFYGRQVLEARNAWKAVAPKLMLREGPLEAFSLVAEGKAQAGFAYLTCPLDTNPEKASRSDVRIVEKVARDTYGPVRLQVGILAASPRRLKAQLFVDFLTSPQVQQAMSKDGVLPVEVLK